MATKLNSALISYGPSLPDVNMAVDGSLFYKTGSVGEASGIYLYSYISDTSLNFGQQVGRGWVRASSDADTLDGLDSTAFQRYDADLQALANASGTGIYIRTGNGTSTTRAISVGSVKLTIANADGLGGNPTLDLNEGAITLNNLSGSLSILKGGTGDAISVLNPGGVIYAIDGSRMGAGPTGTAGQVLLSAGAGVPAWANQNTLSVGFATNSTNATSATTAGTATYATTAGSANAVTWANVSGKPTTVAGSGITDGVTKTYVDTADYLNFSPQAGVLKNNTIPIYSDFKFSQGKWNDSSYSWVDSEAKQVLFYGTSTPTGNSRVYRAYRYTDADAYIYDNSPVSASFLLGTEKVQAIMNMGTFFAVLRICTIAFPETVTRIVIVKTNGSSLWSDWILAYDVSAIATEYANFSLVSTSSGDRILRLYLSSDASSYAYLGVYNSSLTLLRTQTLYDRAAMVNQADTTGSGKVAPTAMNLINYAGWGTVYPFTWNPFTQSLNCHFSSYYVYTQGSAVIGLSYGLSLAWTIAKTWLDSGSGSNVNLIPVKSSGYRYHRLPDSTWNTDTGGMVSSWSLGGTNPSIVVDEYSGAVHYLVKGSFNSSRIGQLYRLGYNSGYQYLTMGDNNGLKLELALALTIPDGAAWSKSIVSYWGHIIGNNILMLATSTRYGQQLIQATFSTTAFSSVAQGQTNDTLKLDSPTAIIGALSTAPVSVQNNAYPGSFGVTVSGGVPTYYHSAGGQPVYTITASGATRSYTATGLTAPGMPTTIGAKSGIVQRFVTVWNGSTSAPVYWSIVCDGSGYAYMAKYQSGAWSIPGGILFQAQTDAGKANRGDGINQIDFTTSGCAVLTENGRFLFNYSIDYVGGTTWYWGNYIIASDTSATGNVSNFLASPTGSGGYYEQGGYPGSTFGYSSTLGYYRFTATAIYDAGAFVSSRDIRTGVSITEDQWFTNSVTRPQIYLTTESATGLVAYVSSYPLFIGGYYCTSPAQSVSLQPNTVNYVYASKSNLDRTTVDVTASTALLPSSFTRVLIAAITTNATNIVSQVTYPVARHDQVDELSNVTISAKLAGDALAWNGTAWTNQPMVSAGTLSTAITAVNANFANYLLKAGDTATGTHFFTGNKGAGSTLGANSSYGLQAFSNDGGAAAMSFNRSGSYAVNIGLDPDNVFRIGGWSAPANRMALDLATGTVTFAGNVVAYSDARTKKNIVTIPDALNTVLHLRGVNFDRVDDGSHSTGVIAQEVQEVMPQVVHTTIDGTLGVAYGNMVGVLIEAIKAQQIQIDELRSEIERLKS